jgi:hypothetical protein
MENTAEEKTTAQPSETSLETTTTAPDTAVPVPSTGQTVVEVTTARTPVLVPTVVVGTDMATPSTPVLAPKTAKADKNTDDYVPLDYGSNDDDDNLPIKAKGTPKSKKAVKKSKAIAKSSTPKKTISSADDSDDPQIIEPKKPVRRRGGVHTADAASIAASVPTPLPQALVIPQGKETLDDIQVVGQPAVGPSAQATLAMDRFPERSGVPNYALDPSAIAARLQDLLRLFHPRTFVRWVAGTTLLLRDCMYPVACNPIRLNEFKRERGMPLSATWVNPIDPNETIVEYVAIFCHKLLTKQLKWPNTMVNARLSFSNFAEHRSVYGRLTDVSVGILWQAVQRNDIVWVSFLLPKLYSSISS